MMRRIRTLPMLMAALAAAVILPSAAARQGDAAAIARSLANSIVRVEYTLQYDKGQAPSGTGIMERCPSCGEFHVDGAESVLSEERPIETAGYVLSPTRILTVDQFLHPRFVAGTKVVLGDEAIDARPVAYAQSESAVILELARPLAGAAPLKFDAKGEAPFFAVSRATRNGEWAVSVAPVSIGAVSAAEGRAPFIPVAERGVIVTSAATPVGMNLTGELAPDGTWRGSPDNWTWLSADERAALIESTQRLSDAGILRARLDLRSPRVTEEAYSPWSYSDSSEDDEATEIHALAVLVDERTLLVLANLKASVTARLEEVTVFAPGSEEGVSAKFRASLRDYGAFLATLDEPLSGSLRALSEDIRRHRHQLLIGAEISLQGEHRLAYFTHQRISTFNVGWRRHVYPEVAGDDQSLFLFDRQGALVALPVIKRDRPGEEDRWSGTYPTLTAAKQIAETLADLDANTDTSNVPLSEEEENRVAWLGVIMQGLDTELARQMGVSELSDDGSIGGLVTFVYPDSPAAAAQVQTGDVLLRVHVANRPRPLDIEVDEDSEFGSAFPWHQLDEVPEEYFEMIPKPWPNVASGFNRTLTALGFGTPVQVELARGGEVMFAPMAVTQSPTHFDAAPQFKSEPLGFTLRPMTYEVRRHFQKDEEEPGLIIARIEPGSKASVAGLKPFETITSVNDAPVRTLEDFRRATAGQSELRLSILRMTRSRLVKITLDEPIEDEEFGGPAAEAGEQADG